MKRKLACLAALLALLLGLASCASQIMFPRSISAEDYLTGRSSFSCKLRGMRHAYIGNGTDMRFEHKADLAGLAARLEKQNPGVPFTAAQGKFIVIEQADSIFLVEQIEKYSEDRYNRFQVFAPIANLDIDTIFNTYGKLIYMPYHLIEGLETQVYQGQRLLPTQFSFPALGTIDDFEAFYRKWSAVDVARPDGNTLVVTCNVDRACPLLTLTFDGDTVNFSAE